MNTDTSDNRYWDIANLLDDNSNKMYNTISAEDYAQFEIEWVVYILKEYRYGQAFCEHFGIDQYNVLYYFQDEVVARRWIKENFLQKDNSVQN